ncbi:tripartite tricarboxylate transporter TctB family protein [Halorussus marinus]|uniref:tripartite tricarboxylate transporter TctB family protein n=1 Tax=Halorussus marinus TaxID=2505976 RepID=UPI00106DFF5D|nr:tripartite tricarboxylate transporter TctB family protein [Halorussus marinus]
MAIDIRHTDKVGAALLVALSAGVFVASRDFPSGFGETPGAAFFPRVIAATIALLAAVLLVRSVVARDPRTHSVGTEAVVRFAVPAGFLLAYVLVMPAVGFVLGTLGFLVGLMWYSGVRRLRTSVPLGVAIAVVLHYVFRAFLRVPLPEGSVVSLSEFLPSLPLVLGVA